jgi:hypothetical protein
MDPQLGAGSLSGSRAWRHTVSNQFPLVGGLCSEMIEGDVDTMVTEIADRARIGQHGVRKLLFDAGREG